MSSRRTLQASWLGPGADVNGYIRLHVPGCRDLPLRGCVVAFGQRDPSTFSLALCPRLAESSAPHGKNLELSGPKPGPLLHARPFAFKGCCCLSWTTPREKRTLSSSRSAARAYAAAVEQSRRDVPGSGTSAAASQCLVFDQLTLVELEASDGSVGGTAALSVPRLETHVQSLRSLDRSMLNQSFFTQMLSKSHASAPQYQAFEILVE